MQTSQQPDDSGDHGDQEMESMETEDKKPLANQNADVPDATQAVEVMTVVEQAANSWNSCEMLSTTMGIWKRQTKYNNWSGRV